MAVASRLRTGLALATAPWLACHAPPSPAPATPENVVQILRTGDAIGVILPVAAGSALLSPCTRVRPQGIDAPWHPSARDVERFEAALPELVQHHKQCFGEDRSDNLRRYRRQYTGFWRGGERHLYVNFVPTRVVAREFADSWFLGPVGYCDGGHTYFGAEFNLEAGAFVAVEFDHDFSGSNGPCGSIRPG